MCRFRGASDEHARMWVDRMGRRGYQRVRAPLDEAAWRKHLSGAQTLAMMMSDEGRLHNAVLDIDLTRPYLDRVVQNPALLEEGLHRTHLYALELARAAGLRGLDVRLEDSGHKGRHLWLFFDPPAAARDAHALVRALEIDAGPAPDGVGCERFPPASRSTSAAALMKLPLGVHLQSGRRSLLIDATGKVIQDVEGDLARLHPCSSQAMRSALGARSGTSTLEPSLPIACEDPALAVVLEGCPVMAFLVAKAADLHHLNHRERYTLLCIAGHFGAPGAAFIHRVIGRCSNYDRRITEKFIGQLKASPVSCQRIREWLPEVVTRVPCCCRFDVPKGAYPTPVLHAVPEARPHRRT